MTLVVGISGPPRAGKDTIARLLAARIEDNHSTQPQLIALSRPMRETVYAMLGRPYNERHYELHKDVPMAVFGGKTIRQVMIALSEEHIKPTYGETFWIHAGLRRIWSPPPKVVIVTDLGFPIEGTTLTEAFGVANVVFVQVFRPHHDFRKDSRGYVGDGTQTTAVYNDGTTVESISEIADRLYSRLVNRFGWELG